MKVDRLRYLGRRFLETLRDGGIRKTLRLTGKTISAAARPIVLWLYRRTLLGRVQFIGITGSTGKTSTKDMAAGVLARRYRVSKTHLNNNVSYSIEKDVFRIRPSDQVRVQEISVANEDSSRADLPRLLSLLKCRIGVVTNIGMDHMSTFGSQDEIAAAKSLVVTRLPASGTAILNFDDPRVIAMRERCRARVISYGLGEGADLRATNIQSVWPDPLSFTAHYKGESALVRTQFYGAFWVSSALPALAVGLATGLPLSEAAAGIADVVPTERRMEPYEREDGVHFLCDDQKTPLTSVPPTFEVIRTARARRKFIIVGMLSDYKMSASQAYLKVARQALAVADHVAFIGPRAYRALNARGGVADDTLQAFVTTEQAAHYFAPLFREGDLVLLKGQKQDNLRLITKPVSELPPAPPAVNPEPVKDGAFRLVAGLGNPEEEYVNTPHNVGRAVVDALALELDAEWRDAGQAQVAEAQAGDVPVLLIKPQVSMNLSGPVVAEIAQAHGLAPNECIVVTDDVNLPMGRLRWRLKGSDGGHRGLHSVLTQMGSPEIPRFRVGVGGGQVAPGDDLAAHVLRPFAKDEQVLMDRVVVESARALKRMILGEANSQQSYSVSVELETV